MNNHPIGIMDSGIGGLTVARVLHQEFPKERFIFIGDTKRNPYGSRSISEITGFAEEMKDFLLAHQVKMIIIACNTITFSVPGKYYETSVPVVGMSMDLPELSGVKRVAVLATPATIHSHRHKERFVQQFPHMEVVEVPINRLANAIETGAELSDIREIIGEAVREYDIADIEAAVLACTHYPLVRPLFQELMPHTIFMDPAEATIRQAVQVLGRMGGESGKTGQNSFFFTDGEDKAEPLIRKMFGDDAEVRNIDLSGV